jgi:hypothetical protein
MASGRPKTATELASGSIRLAFANYWTLLRAVGIVLIPTFVLGGIVLGYWRDHQAGGLAASGPARTAELVAVAVIVLGDLFAQAVGVEVAVCAAAGVMCDWRQSLSRAWSRAATILAVGLAVAILSGVGLFFFVIPGVFLWILFIAAMPAAVLERRKPIDSLRRSAQLVRGRWWPVFGGYLLIELFFLVCSLPFDGVIAAITRSSTTAQAIGDQVASAFVEVALIPVVIAFVSVVYLDLRLQKERLDPIAVVRETSSGYGSSSRVGDDSAPGREPPWNAAGGHPAAKPASAGDTARNAPGWPTPSPKPRESPRQADSTPPPEREGGSG